MLHALLEYGRDEGIAAEPGFIPKAVRWLFQFSPSGDYRGVMLAGNADDKRAKGAREFPSVPHLKFSGDTPMRQFLVDSAKFAILYEQDEPDAKLLKKHAYFLSLLREAADAEAVLGRIADAIGDATVRRKMCEDLASKTPKAKPTDNVSFAEVSTSRTRILVEEDTWRDWWRGHFPSLFARKGKKASAKKVAQMRCLLSGDLIEPCPTHPTIKGLGDVGGNVETTLVGFNLDAFRSFGLEQSANAAVSADTAAQYAAALNHLLANQSERLGGAKVAYWYTSPPIVNPIENLLHGFGFDGDSFADLYPDLAAQEEPPASRREKLQAVRRAGELVRAIENGERPGMLVCRYRALTLSGNSGRVVIRDWMEGSFKDLLARVTAWFDDLSIVNRYGNDLARPAKLWACLGALVRDIKDVPAPTVASIWRTALTGGAIPHTFAARALQRATIDIIQGESPNHARFGLLKAFLIRTQGDTHMQPYLNEDHPEPAYHCGRLLALLADIQGAAQQGVKAGVIERYYTAASTTPALVLGRLTALSQHHLAKIGQDKARLRHWFDQKVAELWGRVRDQVPPTLSLEQQTLFALGYYQQKAQRRQRNGETDDQQTTEIND